MYGRSYFTNPDTGLVTAVTVHTRHDIVEINSLMPRIVLLSVPKFTANLYCICLSIQSILKQMQYRFAVNYGTISNTMRGINKLISTISWRV